MLKRLHILMYDCESVIGLILWMYCFKYEC